jgi:hypothetical protein
MIMHEWQARFSMRAVLRGGARPVSGKDRRARLLAAKVKERYFSSEQRFSDEPVTDTVSISDRE